jgi:hypothetical protein
MFCVQTKAAVASRFRNIGAENTLHAFHLEYLINFAINIAKAI